MENLEKFLKKWLKKIKLNEPTISIVLGGFVILIVGGLIFNYFKISKKGEIVLQEPQNGSVEFIKNNQTHKVEPGESLAKISEKYYGTKDYWPQIAQLNNIFNPDYLEASLELKLPQISPQPQPENSALPLPSPVINEVIAQPINIDKPITGNTYKVEKGDDLWKIAVRAYGDGYKWPDILKTNNLLNPNQIEVGQELKLPR